MKKLSIFCDDTGIGIKRRLTALFLLNVSDWICTLALLRTGLFREANPLMSKVVAGLPSGFLVKVCMPLALILFAFSKIKSADSRQRLISNNIVLAGTTVYFLLNIYHIICFAMTAYILSAVK